MATCRHGRAAFRGPEKEAERFSCIRRRQVASRKRGRVRALQNFWRFTRGAALLSQNVCAGRANCCRESTQRSQREEITFLLSLHCTPSESLILSKISFHGWTWMDLTRLALQPQALESADLSALSAGDLSPSNGEGTPTFFAGPLNAALFVVCARSFIFVLRIRKKHLPHEDSYPCPSGSIRG